MAKFRETLWFKRGDVDAPVADDSDCERPIEDRYEDDGTLTFEDTNTYSVRTRMSGYIPLFAKPKGEDVSPVLIAELKRGRRPVIAALGASVAAIATVLMIYAF